MAMATTLLRMSVLGIPLLLALFQFINDHVYEEQDERLRMKTQFFGGSMVLSSYLLLAMYYAGLCTVNSTLPPSRLTITVSLFILPLFVIISITLYAQFKQMVKPGLRFATWMTSIGVAWGYVSFYVSIGGGSTRDLVGAYAFLIFFGILGWVGTTPSYQALSRAIFDWIASMDPDDNDDEPEWWGIE